MTSSLVGSEMCIRDRLVLQGVGPVTLWVSIKEINATLGGEHTGVYLPVSYTHLTLPTICSV
eukprot:8213791-Prorocentrum_lima.AAC.1